MDGVKIVVDVGSAAAKTSAYAAGNLSGRSRRFDDRLEIMLGGPADRTLCKGIVSDQNSRVAFAPWPVFDIEDLCLRHAEQLKQLLHGCAMSGPEFSAWLVPLFRDARSRGYAHREIENVNEVAHARSVAGSRSRCEDLKMWRRPKAVSIAIGIA